MLRLEDPTPAGSGAGAAARWWPPVMLDPEWVEHHRGEFDIFHIHFGFDARTPEQLEALVAALRAAGKPLVYTVHDLRNPHHETDELHDAQITVLMNAADELITLTDGAADEISRRWRRTARVLPHPHVVPLDLIPRYQRQHRSRRSAFRIGVHIKSLRASMDPLPVIRALVDLRQRHDGIVIQVNGHRDVLDRDGARRDPVLGSWLQEQAKSGWIDLRVHDYFSDAELWRYLTSLDASVLPYRFGTHSGWLEACRDVGTTVIAPTCGYYTDQAPVISYQHDESGFDADSLQAAVLAAISAPPAPVPSASFRRAQREEISREHADLYLRLVNTSP